MRKKGITLIVLVTTIIILMIFAAMILNGGIINKVQTASEQYGEEQIKEQIKEKIQQMLADYSEEKYRIGETLKTFLNGKKNTGEIEEFIVNDDGTYIITLDGYDITINENLTIVDIKKSESNVSMTYRINLEAGLKDGKIPVLLTFESKKGINVIKTPDGEEIIIGNKTKIAKDYYAELDISYKFIVVLNNEIQEEKTLRIELTEDFLTIKNIIIGKENPPQTSVEDLSQEPGSTTLYINFTAEFLMGGEVNIEPSIPYAITGNGVYTFEVTGTYEDKSITRLVKIRVNKYKFVGGFVQYDAGEWNQEEIDSLTQQGLYIANATKEDIKQENHLKFAGFKEGSSRNDSVTTLGKEITTPNYSGWRILSTTDQDGTKYVTKIIHAGSPENIIYWSDAYQVEYVLSSGTRQTDNPYVYNEENQYRNWNMYIDKKQIDIIDEVHCLQFEELSDFPTDNDLRNIQSCYWTADVVWGYGIHQGYGGWCINYIATDGWSFGNAYCGYGIRPVVTLVDGVKVISGSGTQEDPYVLGK